MDARATAWLRPVMWVAAIVLFIIGGYSDANTTECWAWAFALLTGGLLVTHVPGIGKADRSG